MLKYHRDSHEPNCNQTLADTILDMQLLSQITTRIRLYSSECNQTAMVLEAIKQSKTNLKVFLGIYRIDEAGYQRQKTALKEALQTYGTSNILGITVDYMPVVRATVVNDTNEFDVFDGNFTDIRQMLTSMDVNLPVGPADGASVNTTLFRNLKFRRAFIIPQCLTPKVADLFLLSSSMVRVDAWNNATRIQDAAKWSFAFFNKTSVELAKSFFPEPEMYMTEVGWPTNSSSSLLNPSAASVENLQIFINHFVCMANTLGVKYFFSDYMDNPWKEERYSGVAGSWGLFNSDRTLKAITLPDCAHV